MLVIGKVLSYSEDGFGNVVFYLWSVSMAGVVSPYIYGHFSVALPWGSVNVSVTLLVSEEGPLSFGLVTDLIHW